MSTTITTENFSVPPLPEAEVARALRGTTQPRRDVGGIVLNVMFGIVREGFPATADLAAAGDWDYWVTDPDERREQWHEEMQREIRAALGAAGLNPDARSIAAEVDEAYTVGEVHLALAQDCEKARQDMLEALDSAWEPVRGPDDFTHLDEDPEHTRERLIAEGHAHLVSYEERCLEIWQEHEHYEAWNDVYKEDPGYRFVVTQPAPRRLPIGGSAAPASAIIWRTPTGRAPRSRTNHRTRSSRRGTARGDPDLDEPPSHRRLLIGGRR